jgi:hypothetical protein
MVIRRIARWSLVAAVVFAVSVAGAQNGSPVPGANAAKLREACVDDLQRFCIGVRPGGGRLVECLSSHTPELSVACGNMIAARHARGGTPEPSAQSPFAEPAAPVTGGNPPASLGSILRASCGPDAQRLCAGARSEINVLKCLDTQRMELSTVCSSYFKKLGAQPTAQKNIPSKKPPSPPPTILAKPPLITYPSQAPANHDLKVEKIEPGVLDLMSAICLKQTWASALHMSAFGGKADMTVCRNPLSRSLSGLKRT